MNLWNLLFTVGACCDSAVFLVSHSLFDHMMVLALVLVIVVVLPFRLLHLLDAMIQRYIYPGKQQPSDQEAK